MINNICPHHVSAVGSCDWLVTSVKWHLVVTNGLMEHFEALFDERYGTSDLAMLS